MTQRTAAAVPRYSRPGPGAGERMAMRRAKAAIVLAAGLFLAGCGGGSGNPSDPVVSGSFTVTAAPNPITAVSCDPAVCGAEGVLVAIGNVTVTEAAGTGGVVNLIAVSLRNAATNAEVGTFSWSAQDIANRVGSNRVSPRGSLTIPDLGVAYRLPGGARAAIMTFAVAVTDDRGTQRSFAVTVNVV